MSEDELVSMARFVAEYSEWLRYQPPPPVRVDVGPGVVDAFRVLAQSPMPPAGQPWTLFHVPVVEVLALGHGAWQLTGVDGRLAQAGRVTVIDKPLTI